MPKEERAYIWLYKAMKEIVEEQRRYKIRQAELRGHSGHGGRGRQPGPPAYPASLEENNNQRAETPKPQGSSNRRGRSRGRSASPAPRNNQSTSTPNKAKVGCLYFNKRAGSCKFGDKCHFSHDPKVEVVGLANAGKGKGKGKGKRKRRGSNSRSASPAGGSNNQKGSSSRGSTPARRTIDSAKYKTVDCRYSAKGNCTFGDKCAFKHNE